MKSLKSLFSIYLIVFSAIVLSSCSKSNDPTPTPPAQKTQAELNLDAVKASLSGTWTFKTVTVTQTASNKTATTAICAKTELSSAGFGNTQWQNITPLPKLTYSGTTTATLTYPCISGNPTDTQNWTLSQTSDTSFVVSFGDIMTFNVLSTDVSSTEIKAKLISNGTFVPSNLGYNVIYTFTK